MPIARPGPPALTDADVTALRAQLERGAHPRVRLRAGGTGTVVGVGDPATDGPEYLKVKVTLNGTRDTLPFAPEDLASTASSPTAAAPAAPTKAATRRARGPQSGHPTPSVVITVRTAEAEWLVDAVRDGATITEGVAVPASVVEAFADQCGDALLATAAIDVATGRRAATAARVELLRAELAAAEALLASYPPGRSPAAARTSRRTR